MKNIIKLVGIIALIAVIVFSMIACGGDTGGDAIIEIKNNTSSHNITFLDYETGPSTSFLFLSNSGTPIAPGETRRLNRNIGNASYINNKLVIAGTPVGGGSNAESSITGVNLVGGKVTKVTVSDSGITLDVNPNP